jgi:hypothetical protein
VNQEIVQSNDDDDIELSEEIPNKSSNHTQDISATVGVSGTVTVLEDLIRLFAAGDDWRNLHEASVEAKKVGVYQQEKSSIQAKKTAFAKKKQDELILRENESRERTDEARRRFEDSEGVHHEVMNNLTNAEKELKAVRQRIETLSEVFKKESHLLTDMKNTAHEDVSQLKKLYMLYQKISSLEFEANHENDTDRVFKGCMLSLFII